jgi:exodeoxyribonuclease VII small subunit
MEMVNEANEPKKETVEELFERIDRIIGELEAGKDPLDEVLEKFREAVSLYRKAKVLLSEARIKVTEMMNELEEEHNGVSLSGPEELNTEG